MTNKELIDEITRRTHIRPMLVKEILRVQAQIIGEALTRQEKVEIKGVLKIHSSVHNKSFIDPKTNLRAKREMIMLSVKPVRSFREELNRWTSTES